MPLVKINYSSGPTKDILNSLSRSLTQLIAKTLGKSEEFVMIIFERTVLQSFGTDTISPSLYIEVKNVGVLSPQITSILSSGITQICSKSIEVKPSRIYLEFQESERHLWGWNGSTLA
tara:strand:- start:529 stop:882 length:354 start_codon:yes stop_codon:yes gene_type:complete